nr:helix-turn-helix domain-containing protein [Shinella pollutisoli]
MRQRVRELEALLVPDDVNIPVEWSLTNAERRVFAALTVRDIVTKDMLYQALYGDRLLFGESPASSVVESHVSKLRAKVGPFGVVITGERFVGYRLADRQSYRRKAASHG